MAYRNQQHFIDVLEKAGELIRIEAYVDPRLEIAEITDRVSKEPGGGKALLFENTGYDFPVLMNAYGSDKRMCLALGVSHLNDTAKEIEALFKLLTKPKENIIEKLKLLPKLGQFASWMPKVKSGALLLLVTEKFSVRLNSTGFNVKQEESKIQLRMAERIPLFILKSEARQ